MTDKIQKHKDYYLKNREHIIERQKEYNKRNKDIIKEKLKNDPNYKENKAAIMRKYLDNLKRNNPDKYEEMKLKSKERQRKYREIKKQQKIDNGTYNYNQRKPKTLTDEEKIQRIEESREKSKEKYLGSLKNDEEKLAHHRAKGRERARRYLERKRNSQKNL